MSSRTRKAISTAAALTVLFALAARGERPEKHHPGRAAAPAPPLPRARGLHGAETRPAMNGDAERTQVIRRAQAEIQKNPSQRKFILFRYGLNEEDVR